MHSSSKGSALTNLVPYGKGSALTNLVPYGKGSALTNLDLSRF